MKPVLQERTEISFDWEIREDFTAEVASKLNLEEKLRISEKMGQKAFTAKGLKCERAYPVW